MRLIPFLLLTSLVVSAQVIHIETPVTPPAWAYAERALLKESTDAAVEFAAKYVDSRGHFLAVERWGGNDGPDDVMETFNNWPLAYALGADARILDVYTNGSGKATSISFNARKRPAPKWRRTVCTGGSFPPPSIGNTTAKV